MRDLAAGIDGRLFLAGDVFLVADIDGAGAGLPFLADEAEGAAHRHEPQRVARDGRVERPVGDDGRVLDSGDIRFARGNAKRVLSEQDMRVKFMDCTQRQANLDREALWSRLTHLEQVSSARELAAA